MDTADRSRRRLILGILVCAVVVRLGALVFFPQPIEGDSPGYDRIARNFLAGRGCIEDNGLAAHRTPLYPFMLAVIYAVSDHNVPMVYLVQILMDLVCVYLVYRIAQMIFGSDKVGLCSAVLYALYPTFIVNSITLLTETPFTLLILIFVFAFLRACVTQSWGDLSTSALALAASALCRPVTVGFMPLFLLYLFCNARGVDLSIRLRRGAVVLAAFSILVVPWGIRNYRLLGAFVPSTTSVGHHLLYAQTPIVLKRDLWGETTYPMYYETLRQLGEHGADALPEAAADKKLKALAVRIIREHPFQFVSMSVNRFIRLWLNVGYGYAPSPAAWLVFWGQLGILVVASYGYFVLKGRWRGKFGVASLLIIYFTLVHSVMHAAYRYIVPVMPFVLMVCAHACIQLWQRTGRPLNDVTART